jgi:hypothetical protein
MHRVIDQQLMDKHQDEWRDAPIAASRVPGSSGAGRSPSSSSSSSSSRRLHRRSEEDKRLFSFFKKN